MEVEVEEEVASNNHGFLIAPPLAVDGLVDRIHDCLLQPIDTCFQLRDGEVFAHETVMKELDHFKNLLGADFVEGRPCKRLKLESDSDSSSSDTSTSSDDEGLSSKSSSESENDAEMTSKSSDEKKFTLDMMKQVKLPLFP